MQKKIVFFGSGYYTIPIIEKLKDEGLILVVTTEPKGHLIDYLGKHKVPFLYSRLKSTEDIKKIQDIKPDLGVLASFGAILPKQIIDLFPMGILNIHPSLLPKYKGSSPIQFTILDGINVSGVSVIKLDDKVDHGSIVTQKEVKLTGNETLESLTELMFEKGSELIYKIVQDINNGLKIELKPQSIKDESWTQKIAKKDAEIDLVNPPSKEVLKRQIRAFYPWPGVHLSASLGGKIKILKLMPNDIVQVEGKNPMSYKDFINGYGQDAKQILEKLSLWE